MFRPTEYILGDFIQINEEWPRLNHFAFEKCPYNHIP